MKLLMKPYFNSTLVQLIVTYAFFKCNPHIYFNSTLVQLIGDEL